LGSDYSLKATQALEPLRADCRLLREQSRGACAAAKSRIIRSDGERGFV
jgi:hypothetical protein